MAALRVADLSKMIEKIQEGQDQMVSQINLQTNHINKLQNEASTLRKALYVVGTVAVSTGIYSLVSLMSLV